MEHKLIFGNCLEIMKDVPDKSVDMVLADPPYGTTQCKWDSVINLDKMWKQLKRIVKPRGAIVMTASQPFTSVLITSNLNMYKQSLVWEKNKSTGHLNANRMHMRAHEDIVIFYKKLPVYNPIFGEGIAYSNNHKSGDSGECYGDVKSSKRNDITTRYPRSVLKFDVDIKAEFHSTQKPIRLMEYLIKTYTNKNDLVLDFTCGSGSTIIACENTGRHSIGIDNGLCEKNKIINGIQIKGLKWIEIAQLRLDGKI